jgi:hypothetical protein
VEDRGEADVGGEEEIKDSQAGDCQPSHHNHQITHGHNQLSTIASDSPGESAAHILEGSTFLYGIHRRKDEKYHNEYKGISLSK